jgi:hypothetical protein
MVRPYGHKLKLDEGKPFSFCSFSWTKKRANEKANDIKKKGYNIRVIPGKNENGKTVHLVYKRKK